MDSDPSIPFGWHNDGTAYDQIFDPDLVHEAQAYNNVSMGNYETGPRPGPYIHGARDARSSRRARSEHLDWNAHKDTIKKLYLDQNKSLSETIEAMKEQYSFDASQRLYKTKFKEWNWQKNLSTDTALKMMEKSKRRKREEDKDTVFSFGGRVWDSHRVESTLVRTKKSTATIDLTNVSTPEGVSYKTPKALVESPAQNVMEHSDMEGIEIEEHELEESSDDDPDVKVLSQGRLALRWQGYSRTDLQEMWRTALRCRDTGDIVGAENMLSRAVAGLSHVMGKTNADTVKAAYHLADLNAKSDRMEHAIDLLEKVMNDHLETYGRRDTRTQQNVLHAVELLNGWNREADAVGLLSLSKELLESSTSPRHTSKASKRASKKGKANQKSIRDGSQLDLSGVTQSVLEDVSPTRVDYGLGVARTHIAMKDQATEDLLLAIISQCQRSPALSVQHLKALAELLDFYGKVGQATDHGLDFRDALSHLHKAWEAYDWKEDSIESLDFMEAALQLVANMLKYGPHMEVEAESMFRKASEKSSEVFGWEDERTVWVNITIGLVYQTHRTWDDAEEWFEEALAAALTWGRPKDGIVRSLENARSHHHFSYVSDEGRPFKTIFGVSGLVIRPGRLHLE
ncbi:MAG: hypothetical protein L6R38_004469 [Xanthoria sp. 2 TBL-2021]|nr:MAG: hypothetical protein L6R38_004469 [Xanthoria sp. 2 TBL-2021]